MPKYFEFIEDSDPDDDNYVAANWSAPLKSIRCVHLKNGGEADDSNSDDEDNTRCKRRTVIGSPFCWQHLLLDHEIRVKKSQVIPEAGLGIYALNKRLPANAIIFRNNEKIVDYYGEMITEETLDERYGRAMGPYAHTHLNAPRGKPPIEDGALKRGVGSLANEGIPLPPHPTAHDRARAPNARIRTRAGKSYLEATRPIRNGTEILAQYGNFYTTEQDQGGKHRTFNRRK